MNDHMDDTTAAQWWSSRRLQYNRGLCISGFIAYIAYLVLGSILLSGSDFEVTLFTLFFQGLAFLVMVIIANIFYSLGYASERILRPKNPERYREICYRMGYGFSIFLPFSVPVLIVVSAII